MSILRLTEAVQQTEAWPNNPNRWHLVYVDTGVGAVRTFCHKRIPRTEARITTRESIEREGDGNYRVRRCKRCWEGEKR